MFNWSRVHCQTGICQAYEEELELPLFRDYDHVNRIGVAKLFNETKKTIDKALSFI